VAYFFSGAARLEAVCLDSSPDVSCVVDNSEILTSFFHEDDRVSEILTSFILCGVSECVGFNVPLDT